MRLQLFFFLFPNVYCLSQPPDVLHALLEMCSETLSELDGEIAISEKHKKSGGIFWKDRHTVTELEFCPVQYFSDIKAFQGKRDLPGHFG